MKLCIECRHVENKLYEIYGNKAVALICGRRRSPVDGKSVTGCYEERGRGLFIKRCGPDGTFWEAKKPLD